MRISDWSSDVCSSDLGRAAERERFARRQQREPVRTEGEPGRNGCAVRRHAARPALRAVGNRPGQRAMDLRPPAGEGPPPLGRAARTAPPAVRTRPRLRPPVPRPLLPALPLPPAPPPPGEPPVHTDYL